MIKRENGYQYEGITEAGVGDTVSLLVGFYNPNLTGPIRVTGVVEAVDRERAVLVIRHEPVEAPEGAFVPNPGPITERFASGVEVLSIRIFEPDDESVFTDVPAADVCSLTAHQEA